MKVLLVSPKPPPTGGIASWTINLLDYLALNSDGLELKHQDTALKDRNILSKGLFSRIYFGIIESLRIIIKFKINIRDYKPNIIHLTSSASFALFKDYCILRYAIRKEIPIIIHWHFGRIPSLSLKLNWEWKLLIRIIRKCHTSIVIDEHSNTSLINAGISNTVNIPNPIGINLEQKSRISLPKNSHQQNDRLIFVGHIIKSKGVYELVEACANLPLIRELLLVGPYELMVKEQLVRLAGPRDNGDWLKFQGTLDNESVLEQMHDSTILVLPSYTEGFPFVVIESMAMGCAVIATDVGAIPEILAIGSNSPCGICVPIENVEKLSEAIVTLSTDSLKTATMGKNGHERVLNNYTMKEVVKQYKSVWLNATT